MNKAECIKSMAEKSGLSLAEASRALAGFEDCVTEQLVKGEEVVLLGFGKFSAVKRDARMGRNPSTGAPIQVKATRVPKFKAGANLKKAVHLD